MASDSSIQEDWKWETPVFTANGNVCAVGSFKESIKVNFFKGASLLRDRSDPRRATHTGFIGVRMAALVQLDALQLRRVAVFYVDESGMNAAAE